MSSDNGRIKVGLALGGGVARGLAHIGVLSVLEKANIPIDCIAGTSMGAIIGAAYCAGLTIEDLRGIAARTGWWQVSRPLFSAGGFVTFKHLEAWMEDNIGQFDVRDLAIPFAAVASDLISGERVVLSEGRLCTAVRASCSVPGFVPPVEQNDHILVDGGITDNIPADVARLLGADYVIGVDIFMPALRPRLGPFSQGLAAIETLVRHAGRGANECDCLIVPHMEGRSYFKFSDYERLIVLGEEAALQQLPAIRQSLERAEAARQRPAAALSIASPEVGSLHGAN
ncbi:MAG: patatin-like phospholipase family protein [Anaerolineae bacterium]|uniref:patatin-like phospholipase family protein n=1 Tax=Promineifilum sp. TaxID=2664178 RepID=UPI001DDBF857|nr:patatin-like phospholipase family protein [Anaerolineales bacterium]MCB8934195.1 patatin-like phospholipase family protein [Promineifilum sp.]MCO5179816.1 patatin-like phospholipase family protein [Promineifilum sp.]MCW5845624.1 patatin-like phospholipase family protein [Anaerolineae bacterium]